MNAATSGCVLVNSRNAAPAATVIAPARSLFSLAQSVNLSNALEPASPTASNASDTAAAKPWVRNVSSTSAVASANDDSAGAAADLIWLPTLVNRSPRVSISSPCSCTSPAPLPRSPLKSCRSKFPARIAVVIR